IMSGHYFIAILFMVMYLIIHIIFYKAHQIKNDKIRVMTLLILPFLMFFLIIITILIDTGIGAFLIIYGGVEV
ncbi:hypothetical protein CD155_09055, partial [Staphylococcus caprae]